MAEYIAFDELTHFTQEEYEYLKSRNRPNGPGTRVYMRATANGSSPWCGSAPIGPSADVAPVVHGEWLSRIIAPTAARGWMQEVHEHGEE